MKLKSQNEDREKIALIEAALYVAGRPLGTNKLGSIIGIRSKREARRLTRTLLEEYSKRNSALELIELKDDRFVLQLKPQYVPQVRKLPMRSLLSSGPLKTLSYIAYHQPVVQSRVVVARGSHVYKHIQELEEMGLIMTEKLGRTKMIRTTKVFADYFNLSRKPRIIKRQLEALFSSPDKKSTVGLTPNNRMVSRK